MFNLLLLALDTYQSRTIEGWNLKIEASVLAEHTQEWKLVERELQTQLYRIVRVVPEGPLAKLRRVTIWIHWTSPETKCMAYHPGSQWLKDHKMNPDMAKGIEIGDAKAFVSWTFQQPWMVLHELAHAYHDQFLEKGFENPNVKGVFEDAMKAKRYNTVLHWNGASIKHYACTNPMEFFAEASEAYFGMNDFYPFVNAELKTFDTAAFELMKRTWGEPKSF